MAEGVESQDMLPYGRGKLGSIKDTHLEKKNSDLTILPSVKVDLGRTIGKKGRFKS